MSYRVKKCRVCDAQFQPVTSTHSSCSFYCSMKLRRISKLMFQKKYLEKNKNSPSFKLRRKNINEKYIINHPEKRKETVKKSFLKNREKRLLHRKNYYSLNREKFNFKTSKRRADILGRVPSWLSDLQIQQIKNTYKSSKEKTKESGIPYSVDHIIPIKGKNVSGLHVPWNLRVITQSENLIKGNRYEG